MESEARDLGRGPFVHGAAPARRGACATLVALVAASALGCSAAKDTPGEVETSSIVGGGDASRFTMAVTIQFQRDGLTFDCSGALVAPKVVLTAGHCAAPSRNTGFEVKAPFAGGQRARGRGVVFDYDAVKDLDVVDPARHDVGVLLLDTPIQTTYATVLARTITPGERVVCVGANGPGDGPDGFDKLYATSAVEVAGVDRDFPHAYALRTLATEGGDSGGPCFLANEPFTIAATISGALATHRIAARLDEVATWLAGFVAPAGGATPRPDPPRPAGDAPPFPPLPRLCFDFRPHGDAFFTSCEEHAAAGRCGEPWMSGSCDRSCGRCAPSRPRLTW